MPDGARVAETNKPRAEVNGRGSVATTDNGPVEEVGREVDSRPTGPAMDPRVVARLPAGQQVRLLQHMQRGYGNAQVARMVSQLQTPPTRRATDDRDAPPVSPAGAPPHNTSDTSTAAQRAIAVPAPIRPQEIHLSPSVESAGQPDRPDQDFGEGREEQPLQRMVEGVGAPAAPPNGNGIVQRSSYVLNKASEWAHDVPGYSLLTVILGKDPINDEAVPRTAVNFVHGVISLIPGGDAIFKNLQDSGALDQAFQWLNTETAKLGITWGAVKGALQKVLDSIGIADLADPGAAWDRVKHIIMPLIDKVKQFAVDAGKKLFEFVLEGALKMAGPLAGTIMAAIKKAGDVINTIAKDPVAFLGNLLRAVKGGFEQFMGNIETHLKQGLMGWLFGSLAGAGIELPKSFDLKGILSLVLQILGLSWQNLRTKLVGALGEPVVSAVEKTVGFVKTIASEGIGAAWQQIVQWITESIGSLKDMVLGAIKDWVVSTIIKQAVMKLVSMFNPVGAIIQAIITIYNTVEFVIDKAKQIADLANAVLDSIANIASGNIAAAANYVEQTLGKAVPVVIGFLADLIGLGGITDKIKDIIQKIRQPIDKVMGKLVGFVASKAKPIIDKIKAKGQAIVGAAKGKLGIGAARGETGQSAAVKQKAHEALSARTRQPLTSFEQLQSIAQGVQDQLRSEGLKSLRIEAGSAGKYAIFAEASPETEVDEAEVKGEGEQDTVEVDAEGNADETVFEPAPAGENGDGVQRKSSGSASTASAAGAKAAQVGAEGEAKVSAMLLAGSVPGLPKMDVIVNGQFNPSGHGIDIVAIRVSGGRLYLYRIEVKWGDNPALEMRGVGLPMGPRWTRYAVDGALANPALKTQLMAALQIDPPSDAKLRARLLAGRAVIVAQKRVRGIKLLGRLRKSDRPKVIILK